MKRQIDLRRERGTATSFKVITSRSEIKNATLRERYDSQHERAWDITRFFILRSQDDDVGLVLIDELEGQDARLYEVFITSEKRNRGFGRIAVKSAEEWARAKGFESISLVACAFGDGLEQELLVQWYERLGYVTVAAVPEPLMRKCLVESLRPNGNGSPPGGRQHWTPHTPTGTTRARR